MPPPDPIASGGPVVAATERWHKLFALLLYKLAPSGRVVITYEELRAYQAEVSAGRKVLMTLALADGIEVGFITREEAARFAAHELEAFVGRA
jgi:hypothetical protein